jgi:outer membrane biosynthesis protein TonB
MSDTASEIYHLSNLLDGESKKSFVWSLVTLLLLVLCGVVPAGLTFAHHVHSTEDHQVIELEFFDHEAPPSLEMLSREESARPTVQKIVRKPVTPSLKNPQPSNRSGETSAQVLDQVLPTLPDSLRREAFRSYVRVSVSIGKDGASKVSFRESSGNAQVDAIVMRALSQWKWKPAEKFGEPIDSEKNFKFIFEVR